MQLTAEGELYIKETKDVCDAKDRTQGGWGYDIIEENPEITGRQRGLVCVWCTLRCAPAVSRFCFIVPTTILGGVSGYACFPPHAVYSKGIKCFCEW